jgi:ribosomal protein S18 acetylase RimI-like enzyme
MLPARQAAFLTATDAADETYFGAQWGAHKLKALSVATDPAYFRRGAGTALMEWAMRLAQEELAPIVLTAGAMGIHLYRKLGFQELGVVRIHVKGEDEETSVSAMIWIPEGWKREVVDGDVGK